MVLKVNKRTGGSTHPLLAFDCNSPFQDMTRHQLPSKSLRSVALLSLNLPSQLGNTLFESPLGGHLEL